MFKEIVLKEKGTIPRLTAKTFKFDKRIKKGFFSANYFLKSTKIVAENFPDHIVTMQFFQRKERAFVCGLDEVISLIHQYAIEPEHLIIEALNDGDEITSLEPVLKVTGRYEHFGFLESLIDGILARRTSVCTNVREVVEAANGVPIFSMADRQDDYLTQIGDGYATYVGGVSIVSTDAQGYSWNGKGGGTMPHALIQVCGGDVLKAADAYLNSFPKEKVTALIDYRNDVVRDSVMLANHLRKRLKAVRVDTSMNLTDHYFDHYLDKTGLNGVSEPLIRALREELDKANAKHVKIIVSSSFDKKKITDWTTRGVPVDMFGVGTSFVNNMTCSFTGDLVVLDGKHQAKEGREDIYSSRLIRVPYPIY